MSSRFCFRIGLALFVVSVRCASAAPFAYIPSADVGDRTVSVIDTATNMVIATIATGQATGSVAVNKAGTRVYLAWNGLSAIDTVTNAVTGPIPLPGALQAVAVNPAGTRVYVVNQTSNSVNVFDTTTDAFVATVALGGRNPIGIDVNPAGTRVYVAQAFSNSLSIIDTTTNLEIATLSVGTEPVGVAVNPAGTRVYVANRVSGTISVVDTTSNMIFATLTIGGGPAGVAVNSSGTRIYVTNQYGREVWVINAINLAVVAHVSVGDHPTGIDVNPAGTRVYVANALSESVSVIDTATNAVVATVAVGKTPIALGRFIGPVLGGPGSTSSVVEYHNSDFDHYFITPIPAEIALLDARQPPFVAWSRTGFSFNSYLNQTAPTSSAPICRFFNTSFAPKSSHFYAAQGFGCETTLLLFPDWKLEDDKLFNAILPDPNGTCPSDTVAVYRLYNGGLGGAPNHRFVTDLAERQKMLDQGYIAEGAGIGVGMCALP